MNIKITGTGSYIPEIVQDNSKFLDRNFFDNEGNRIDTKNEEIIEKFQKITGIRERRYAKDELNTSDIAYLAAKEAIKNSKVNPEKIDYIILAHNFGNASNNSTQVDVFPSLAVRVKNLLKIKNPKCVAYDILFGCPGWLEGVIQGYGFIKEDDSDTEHFVHVSGLIDRITEGDKVEFELKEGNKGLNAINVKVVS